MTYETNWAMSSISTLNYQKVGIFVGFRFTTMIIEFRDLYDIGMKGYLTIFSDLSLGYGHNLDVQANGQQSGHEIPICGFSPADQ